MAAELERAFQMLDIIQGHPGYAVHCWQCGNAMTDIFGNTHLLPAGVGAVMDREGARHDLGGSCPVMRIEVPYVR